MIHPRLPRRSLWTVAACVLLAGCLGAAPDNTPRSIFTPDDGRHIANPERGVYVQFTSQDEQSPLDVGAVRNLRDDHMTLILRMYYLKTFRDRPLSDAQLELIRNDFAVIREAGAKCILRFAYSQAIGEPDAPIDIVLGHMDQLEPILRDNVDVILAAQAGFVGAWGEWHASTNELEKEVNAKRIVARWLEALPPTRCVQLRTPRQKWMVLGTKSPLTADTAFAGTPASRIGHHNDCFISSDTDVGTYADIENEKTYLGLETRFVPMGGETCALTTFAEPDNARDEMENLHFTYLNLGYHPDVIQMWKTGGFFKEVKRRMGYRLSLVSFAHDDVVSPGDALAFTIEMQNTGFAAPVNPRFMELILVSEDGQTEFVQTLPHDARTWLPGGPITCTDSFNVPSTAKPGIYKLYLRLPDPEPTLNDNPDYAIQLANPGLWDATTGRHDLGATVTVE